MDVTDSPRSPRGVPEIAAYKARGDRAPLVMVTAYDEPGARLADRAGVDLLLVGDSVGTTVLGYEDTLSVTLDNMVQHTRAVCAARPSALVVADMPWLTYHTGTDVAVANAARLVLAGAKAVKLEGGSERVAVIEAIVRAEIPVMGHLGLTPQSVLAMGGYRVQGRDPRAAHRIVDAAKHLEQAGCFAVVLEGIPDALARDVTASLPIPTIGIGAGVDCDGQVLVFHDLVGLTNEPRPKFVRTYVDLSSVITEAIGAFAADVRARRFPDDTETYHAPRP